MKSILVLNILFAMSYGDLGPCRPVKSVHADICKWPTRMYLNMYTQDLGQTCSWVNRYLNYTDDDKILFSEQYRRLVHGSPVNTLVNAEYVDEGHYKYSKAIGDKVITLDAYFLWFDPPNIDIHYVCSDHPDFKNAKGTGAVFIESMYPGGPYESKEKIYEVLRANGFNTSELITINNCNCSNIPGGYGPGKCEKSKG